jgi:hypothetical protein
MRAPSSACCTIAVSVHSSHQDRAAGSFIPIRKTKILESQVAARQEVLGKSRESCGKVAKQLTPAAKAVEIKKSRRGARAADRAGLERL